MSLLTLCVHCDSDFYSQKVGRVVYIIFQNTFILKEWTFWNVYLKNKRNDENSVICFYIPDLLKKNETLKNNENSWYDGLNKFLF